MSQGDSNLDPKNAQSHLSVTQKQADINVGQPSEIPSAGASDTPSSPSVPNGVNNAELSTNQSQSSLTAAAADTMNMTDSQTNPVVVKLEAASGEEENGTNGMSDSQSSNEGDQDWSSDGFDPDLRRVKASSPCFSRFADLRQVCFSYKFCCCVWASGAHASWSLAPVPRVDDRAYCHRL